MAIGRGGRDFIGCGVGPNRVTTGLIETGVA